MLFQPILVPAVYVYVFSDQGHCEVRLVGKLEGDIVAASLIVPGSPVEDVIFKCGSQGEGFQVLDTGNGVTAEFEKNWLVHFDIVGSVDIGDFLGC